MKIESVLGKILLQIIFAVKLQHHPRIGDWNERKFGVTQQCFVVSDDKRQMFTARGNGLKESFEMISESFRGKTFVCNWGLFGREVCQLKARSFSDNLNCFGCATTQIYCNHLGSFFCRT